MRGYCGVAGARTLGVPAVPPDEHPKHERDQSDADDDNDTCCNDTITV